MPEGNTVYKSLPYCNAVICNHSKKSVLLFMSVVKKMQTLSDTEYIVTFGNFIMQPM